MAKLEDNKTVRCSFCGKPQETVKRIIEKESQSTITFGYQTV